MRKDHHVAEDNDSKRTLYEAHYRRYVQFWSCAPSPGIPTILVISLGILSVAMIVMYTIAGPSKTGNFQRLHEFDIPSSGFSFTYMSRPGVNYTIASASRSNSSPDTTAVILNWSRLQNVLLLSTLLCARWLDDTIAQVFIWNNNPNLTLTAEDFSDTGCSSEKLHIHNSPSNMYFMARFLACAEARSPFCFVQDDDYLVRPEIIKNMHATILQLPSTKSLHLLPPHEHLFSRLRTITTVDRLITTTFAWLGHGAYLNRNSVLEFLRLLRDLKVTDDVMMMADNYFTILANQHKEGEIWFDHGIELGGGLPFTVGAEGNARNDKHVTQALSYLSALVASRDAVSEPTIPYMSKADTFQMQINRAPCRLTSCLLGSNIELLPGNWPLEVHTAEDMVSKAQNEWLALGENVTQWYIQNSLSNIVDGKADTVFHSRQDAKKGDWIMIDALEILGLKGGGLELSFLVSEETERLFDDCTFSTSTDGITWAVLLSKMICFPTGLSPGIVQGRVKECSISVGGDARYYRATFSGFDDSAMRARWVIYEMWLRYLL